MNPASDGEASGDPVVVHLKFFMVRRAREVSSAGSAPAQCGEVRPVTGHSISVPGAIATAFKIRNAPGHQNPPIPERTEVAALV